jgi:glycosyltransferase involved in cell wall biosynthesis
VRILLIGKFPPIEGGVSAHTFWLARSLVHNGHAVHVVTNAAEIDPNFAQVHYGPDHEWLAGTGDATAWSVHQTTPLENGSFIPFSQPHVTKLFGLSLSVLERFDCDIIVSWYLEPYGMAAALVGQAAGRPFVIRHAGSDLGRLARHPQLGSAYRWALKTAAGLVVVNERELEARFGPIDRPRIPLSRPRLPDVFYTTQERLDVKELLSVAEEWFVNLRLPTDLTGKIRRLNAKPLGDDRFVIGIYGKVGVTKGSFDLLHALGKVAATGAEFAFLSVSCGRREILQRYYETILNCPALAARSWILPPVAPWRIPAFLRFCNAVCFLEREFAIPFHGPLIPREILSSGACLVCSKEIAGKPIYRGNLVDERNAVVVVDPKDHDTLAGKLGRLIRDRSRTRSIGLQGRKLAEFWDEELDSFDRTTQMFAEELERLALRN